MKQNIRNAPSQMPQPRQDMQVTHSNAMDARDNYRRRLYDSYVSSGQAGAVQDGTQELSPGKMAYFRAVIERHLPADRSIRIVDLACGHGGLVKCLHDMGYRNARGFDLSAEQVELARRLGIANIEQKTLSEALGEENDSLDVVFLMDVLEHLTKEELLITLDALQIALKRGGTAIVNVPNAEGLHGMRVRYGDLTHEQCFTSNSMRQAFTICGFSQVSCFEDKPVVRSAKSLVRRLLWDVLTLPARLQLLAETGAGGHLLSQNLLVTARK